MAVSEPENKADRISINTSARISSPIFPNKGTLAETANRDSEGKVPNINGIKLSEKTVLIVADGV